jgi:hypothetical protein
MGIRPWVRSRITTHWVKSERSLPSCRLWEMPRGMSTVLRM